MRDLNPLTVAVRFIFILGVFFGVLLTLVILALWRIWN